MSGSNTGLAAHTAQKLKFSIKNFFGKFSHIY